MQYFKPTVGLYESFEFVPGLMEALKIEGCWIAGGYMRNYIAGDAVDNRIDVDLFFSEQDTADRAKEIFLDAGYEVIFQCPEDLLTSLLHKKSGWKVQIIKIKYFGSLEEVLDSFDFTASQVGLDFSVDMVVAGELTIQNIEDRILVLNRLSYPASTIKRIYKYIKAGYRADESF